MKSLELRRHAPRDPDQDRLSAEGRALAESVVPTLGGNYDAVYGSPAARALETADILAPGHSQTVVNGLGSDTGPEGLAEVVRDILTDVPEGGRALAIGHTPLIEKAVEGLTGARIDQLRECEGVLITEESGVYRVEELRLD